MTVRLFFLRTADNMEVLAQASIILQIMRGPKLADSPVCMEVNSPYIPFVG